MREFLRRNRYFSILTVVFVICEVLVCPTGDFPLNDDWTYAKSVMFLHNDGRLEMEAWHAMTLITQLFWGLAFTKVFGFSFFVLRISTLVSSLIGLLFLYRLVKRITNNEITSIIASFCLLLNPIYFNLSNTFMTDINFNTLIVITCWFVYDFHERQNTMSFAMVFVFSVLTLFLRQFGILLPLCFLLSCLFLKEKRWLYTSVSVIATVVIILALKKYEVYLATILPSNTQYKFSEKLSVTGAEFWNVFIYSLETRYGTILYHIMFYTFPFVALFIPGVIRKQSLAFSIIVLSVCFFIVWMIFGETEPQGWNIFSAMNLGAPTFYEDLKGYVTYNNPEYFIAILNILKLIFLTLGLGTVVIWLIRRVKNKVVNINAWTVMLLSLFTGYFIAIVVSNSFFDRYNIPLITLSVIILSGMANDFAVSPWIPVIPLLAMMYVSVAGTKDYFTLHRKTLEAYDYLKDEAGVPPSRIGADIEINYWNEGKKLEWYSFTELNTFDYLIQFHPEKDFETMRAMEFRRYFPPVTDSLFIYKRVSRPSGN